MISGKKIYFETNVEGTRNILKVCDEKIQSVVFTSSVAVYGFAHLMQMKHVKQIHSTFMANLN